MYGHQLHQHTCSEKPTCAFLRGSWLLKRASVVALIQQQRSCLNYSQEPSCAVSQSGKVCPEAESISSLVTAANVQSVWKISYKSHPVAEKGGFIGTASLPPLPTGSKWCTNRSPTVLDNENGFSSWSNFIISNAVSFAAFPDWILQGTSHPQ